jgi:hypothetical protein
VKFFGFLLRLYSYAFHFALSSFLAASAVLASTTHRTMSLDMLPVVNENLVTRAALLAAAGLICTLLAITNVSRVLFPLWAALVVYLVFRGFLSYSSEFLSPETRRIELWLMAGASLALLGAFGAARTRFGRRYF